MLRLRGAVLPFAVEVDGVGRIELWRDDCRLSIPRYAGPSAVVAVCLLAVGALQCTAALGRR